MFLFMSFSCWHTALTNLKNANADTGNVAYDNPYPVCCCFKNNIFDTIGAIGVLVAGPMGAVAGASLGTLIGKISGITHCDY